MQKYKIVKIVKVYKKALEADVEAAKQDVREAEQAVREAVGVNNYAYDIASERAFEHITEEELEGLDDSAIINLGLDFAFADENYKETEKVMLAAQGALKKAEKALGKKIKSYYIG